MKFYLILFFSNFQIHIFFPEMLEDAVTCEKQRKTPQISALEIAMISILEHCFKSFSPVHFYIVVCVFSNVA